MAEYIESEALIRKIRHFAADVIFRGCKVVMTDEESCNPVEWTKGYEQGLKDAANLIVGQPTIDAVPVVHGRWEVVHGVLTPGGDPLLRCPICKARESEHLCGVECRTVWNYCPNCGARMKDGE